MKTSKGIINTFGGPENKLVENNFTFTVSHAEAMTMKVPKYAGNFVVDTYKTDKGCFVVIECNNNGDVKADFTVSAVASGDGCTPNVVATLASDPHNCRVEKPTYRQLEAERDRLEANLASKTEIANQLKDGLAEQFEKEINLKAERDALAAQLTDAFGDGYYDGFLDGAKHHEQTDCNTDPTYLGDDALRCSEIAEQAKSKRIDVPSRLDIIAERDAFAARMELMQSSVDAVMSKAKYQTVTNAELNQLMSENSTLKAERDALAAQVAMQQDVIKFAHNKLYILSHNRKDVSARCIGDADKGFKAVDDYLSENKSPQQCLTEIKAGASRAGFIACAVRCGNKLFTESEFSAFADEHADKIRNAGTGLKDSNMNGGKRQGGE